MSKREDYESRTEELLAPIAEVNQVEIYDVEYVKEGSDYYLRAYIEKPEGVNILDCENVSRALSEALDKADFIPDAYILEVSSPGLGRTLKKDKHLQKSIGEEVEIKPKLLVIDELEVLRFSEETMQLEIRVVCSKGTYIRALARDIGEALASGAHLIALCRTRVGNVRLEDCMTLEQFEEALPMIPITMNDTTCNNEQ